MPTPIDALITDHAKTDVYDYTAYNRVGEAVTYLASLLNGTYDIVVTVTGKHDWTAEDVPTQSDIDTYLADVQAIHDATAQTIGAPTVMAYTVTVANLIETILCDADAIMRAIAAAWRRCGASTSICGLGGLV